MLSQKDAEEEMPYVIYIYTGGACIGNPGPGGFAGIIKFGATTYTVKGGEPRTTNNRMEMRAAIEPLLSLHMIPEAQDADITVHSDSKYLVNAFNEWLDAWRQKGWRTKDKQRVKNQDLWIKMLDAVQYGMSPSNGSRVITTTISTSSVIASPTNRQVKPSITRNRLLHQTFHTMT